MKLITHYSLLKTIKGQSLIEIIIAMAVGGLLIGAAVTTIVPMLRSNLETKNIQIATSLDQEYLDAIKNLAESNWFNIYSPPSAKGPSSQFYLRATSTTYEIVSGTTSTVIEGRTFNQYFSIENVSRNFCGSGDITTTSTTACSSGPGAVGVSDDPSTQKITATVSWPDNRSISRSQYLTRNRNKVFVQTDWSGGPNQEGPITLENNKFANSSNINYTTSAGSISASSLSSAELTSSIFDTGTSTTGVAINTIMWQGVQAASTNVQFQIASASSSAPATWDYKGPDGTNTTYYAPTGSGVPAQINLAYHNNHRFFRYKIFLSFSPGATESPRVDDVIINYSQ